MRTIVASLLLAACAALSATAYSQENSGNGMNIDPAQRNPDPVVSLRPAGVFRFFAELSAIPRCSGNTGAVADYLEEFARRRGLASFRDATGNVIIKKPAQASSSGATVILQAHQDMVCLKKPDNGHDFAADPIRLVVDGDWLRADGTTLGADDGAGMAMLLAVLDDPGISHPPLEGLFTVEEETTMAGIKAVRADQLAGDILINLDAEETGSAYVSCAANSFRALRLPLEREAPRSGNAYLRLTVGGLRGGHSGVEINRGRANAFVLAARFLSAALERGIDFGLCSLDNGSVPGKENAIPAQAEAVLCAGTPEAAESLRELAREWEGIFRNEFRASDPGARIAVEALEGRDDPPVTGASLEKLVAAIRLAPLGVSRFIQYPDLLERPYGEVIVETSCNMGIVRLDAGEARLHFMTRGSVATAMDEAEARLTALAALAGGEMEESDRTDGWEMASPPGRVQGMFRELGWRLVGVHGGLECGTLVETMRRAGRTLDAISIGPEIDGAHTPDEKLRIDSVAPCWNGLLKVLAEL